MAEEAAGKNGGKAAEGKSEAQAAPSLSVLAQYVKDFSFENPNPIDHLTGKGKQPQINININVNAKGISPTDVEVSLVLEAKATDEDKTVFNAELDYAGIFRIQNVPQDSMQPIVLIECPRLMFPFARQIIAEATRNGGYPPLMIDPIDFAALYRQRMAGQAQGKGAEATAAKKTFQTAWGRSDVPLERSAF